MGDVERVMERVHRLLAIANAPPAGGVYPPPPPHPTTSSA